MVSKRLLIALFVLFGCSDPPSTPITPVSLDITPDSLVLLVGQEQLMFASTTPATPDISFTISDPHVLSLTNGVIKAINPGVSYVIARAGSLRDSARITVRAPYVDLTPDSVLLEPNQFTHLAIYVEGGPFSVVSRDAAIAGVFWDTNKGKIVRQYQVTGHTAGTTYIVAEVEIGGGQSLRDSTKVVVK